MHARWFNIVVWAVLAVGTVDAAGPTIEELIREVGPQPPEIMEFLRRPEVTILWSAKTEWKEPPRVYIRHGHKVQDGCGFDVSSVSDGTSEQKLSETIANDFTTCEVLVIEGKTRRD